ncbi:unnamed protein product [Parascedosporium putredinis]|uniref:Glutathione S-transferase omega-like 2 n=1 Tax=Parascedosporium putredinis TaxID=1442378 RepID=A0A9P1H7Y5_9PEZI|nr:unnamed protein product [Parascedosporium putredinis]CAI7998829.1 unnamed protein product [Parascedosporium putredinis]
MGITDWVKTDDKSGEFKRQVSSFRSFITKEPGSKFPPEKGRYHLFVSYACPWAHRTLITRKLKGLEDIISFSVVHWHLGGDGRKEYTGRFTVPVLYDKKQNTIVSNESSEIIRMLYTAFDDLVDEKYRALQLFPEPLQSKIDDVNEWTYDLINNGVYKAGFATTQQAYENNVVKLFEALDRTEKHLQDTASEGPYYFGKDITEADIRLYVTIVRFDPVYVQHFKCNIRDIRSGYPAIHKWLRNLYWNHPAFGDTTQFDHIKWHYTKSHTQINPKSITPVGPLPNILPLGEECGAAQR